MEKLVICTTVPETILHILKGQPKYLNQYFQTIIITSKSAKNKLIIESEGVVVYGVNLKRNINLLFDIIALYQMVILLAKIKPKIVHSYTPKAGIITMLSAWIVNIPIRIHTFTGLIFPNQKGLKKEILIGIDKLICFFSTKIIPEGLGVKKDLVLNNITKKTLEIIGNGNISGIDIEYFSNSKVSYNEALNKLNLNREVLEDKFIFCFIGRLNIDKGIKELYESFITLPENTFLLIAGELDTEGNPIPIDLYNKIKDNKRIIYLGFVEDVRLILKISNILVLPSYREGFPNVLLQSLCMKVPAIATNINGSNEIIVNNLNGWLVEPKNHKDLATKMQYVMQITNEELVKIKEQCRFSIIRRYEQTYYRNELIKTYKYLIESKLTKSRK